MNANLNPYYLRVKRHVIESGLASKRSIHNKFHYLSTSELNTIHRKLKLDGVIANNPDGWLCEVISKGER